MSLGENWMHSGKVGVLELVELKKCVLSDLKKKFKKGCFTAAHIHTAL